MPVMTIGLLSIIKYFHQLNIVIQDCIRWSICRIRRAFAKRRRNNQLSTLANPHAHNTFVNPCNDLIATQEKLHRFVIGISAVEQGAISQLHDFMDKDGLPGRSRRSFPCNHHLIHKTRFGSNCLACWHSGSSLVRPYT
jgi:hypothetical protein